MTGIETIYPCNVIYCAGHRLVWVSRLHELWDARRSLLRKRCVSCNGRLDVRTRSPLDGTRCLFCGGLR